MRVALAVACSASIAIWLLGSRRRRGFAHSLGADHAEIGVLVDQFVKDVVKRQNLSRRAGCSPTTT